MRKLIVLEFMSLDGVIQAPGGTEEDPSNSFKYGGWMVPIDDDVVGQTMSEQMKPPFTLLLGKKTYEIWAAYWPHHNEVWPAVNKAKKYVTSHNPMNPEWENSTLLTGNVVEQIKELKNEDGPDLHVYGSANLVQTLLRHDLIDELWLKIFPLTLGAGKRLFAEGTIPAAFKVTDSTISPKGTMIAKYVRAGDVKTGSF